MAACGGEESQYAVVENWECFEATKLSAAGAGTGGGGAAGVAGTESAGGATAESPSCDCYGVASGQSIEDPRPAVSMCSGWRCCYAWPNEDGTYDCRCEDEPAGTQVASYCEGAASERGGEVVDACPPTPRDNAAYCAFQGESCAPDYLEREGLNGCCKGLSCRTDTHGTPVCN
jgi:hypothetical protein